MPYYNPETGECIAVPSPTVMGFTRIALKKLNILMEDEKFVKIVAVEPDLVELEYTDRHYVITNWGRCYWYQK